MSDAVEPRGTMEKVEDSEFEVVRVTIDVEDDLVRRHLEKDPSGAVRRFLEAQGYTVNRLTAPAPVEGQPYRPEFVHILSGKYASTWTRLLP